MDEVKTQEEARQIAIDWQHETSNSVLFMSELAEAGAYFTELAEKFDLVDEFKENGII